MVIERVDQDDEALGLVAVGYALHRDFLKNESVEFVRDSQVVGGAQRPGAEIIEKKAGNAHGGLRNLHDATLHDQIMRLAGFVVGQPSPGLIERVFGRGSVGACQVGIPVSFSSRKSVRASRRTTSEC